MPLDYENIIKRIESMIEKESKHLDWLIANKASKKMIEQSRKYLTFFNKIKLQYIEHFKVKKS